MSSTEEQFQAAVAAMEADRDEPREVEQVSDGEDLRFERIAKRVFAQQLRKWADIIDMPEEQQIREGLMFERICNERKTFTPFQTVIRALGEGFRNEPFDVTTKLPTQTTKVSRKQLMLHLKEAEAQGLAIPLDDLRAKWRLFSKQELADKAKAKQA